MTDYTDIIELDLLTQARPEWFVYHIINGQLPWLNKVGYGGQRRIEQWERRGWVVQTRLVVHDLRDALEVEGTLLDMIHARAVSPRLAELKRVMRSFGRMDGHTEMFDSPYLLGNPDGMHTEPQHVVAIAGLLASLTREFFVG